MRMLAVDRALGWTSRVFDWLDQRWESVRGQRALGTALVAIFLGGLLAVELNRHGWLPHFLAWRVSHSHFAAVGYVFTALLAVEMVGLVLALAHSVAESLGKQFEVFALILLRKAFLEYAHFQEPIEWAQVAGSMPHVLADMAGALLIFVLLGLYYRVQRHQAITRDAHDQVAFVGAKKLIALLLLGILAGMGVSILFSSHPSQDAAHFFATFYTVLVFSDILIVLVAMRSSTQFRVVFRNSGFAASTILIRMALTAPAYVNAALGVGAMAFALALSVAYNAFGKPMAAPVAPPALKPELQANLETIK